MSSLLVSRWRKLGIALPAGVRTADRKVMVGLLIALDGVAIVASTTLAVMLREALSWPNVADASSNVGPFAVVIPLAWLGLLSLSGAYNYRYLGHGMAEYNRTLAGSLACSATLGVGAYLLAYDLSRGFFLLLFMVGVPLLLVGRFTMRRLTNAARARGVLTTHTLLAGRSSHVADLLTILRRERWLGYRVDGLLLPSGEPDPTHGGIPVLGTPEDAVACIRETGAGAVIFADGAFSRANEFSLMARELEDLDAQTIFVPALSDISAGRLQTRPVAGIPLVFVERPHAARASNWAKRLFDIVGSLAALLVFGPLLAVVAFAIWLGDGGSVMFKQVRVGIGGRLFTCYKLRSMVVNAEAMMEQLAAHNESDGVLFKMTDDPRITPIGRIIRRYSIDELPQLFNVLKGDMSLIGPRPALPSEVDLYERHVMRRLAVRPGMSGLWQVSGRSNLSWDDTVRLDLYYVDNWSMMQDLNILLRTVGAVVRPSGAY